MLRCEKDPKELESLYQTLGLAGRTGDHIDASEFTTPFQKQLRFLEAEVSKKKSTGVEISGKL